MTETAQRKPVPKPPSRLPISTGVLWGGIALGTFLAIVAVRNGVVLPLFGRFADGMVTFILFLAVGVVLAELIRRHHRAAARHAIRHGKRGASAAYRGARRHGTRGAGFVAGHAKAQWAVRRGMPAARDDADPPPLSAEWGVDPSAARQSGNSTEGTAMTGDQYPEGIDPILWNRRTGNGTKAATRTRRTVNTVPGGWGAVVAHTTDFQAESDGDLLIWMRGEAIGAAAYAEALVEQHETCRDVIGVDPVAIQTLHDVADAAVTMAATMAAAIKRYTEHYELPNQFVADGGLLAHDGRWHKGDGD